MTTLKHASNSTTAYIIGLLKENKILKVSKFQLFVAQGFFPSLSLKQPNDNYKSCLRCKQRVHTEHISTQYIFDALLWMKTTQQLIINFTLTLNHLMWRFPRLNADASIITKTTTT